jgi:hypothetical protein
VVRFSFLNRSMFVKAEKVANDANKIHNRLADNICGERAGYQDERSVKSHLSQMEELAGPRCPNKVSVLCDR